ncbi:MAG: hypothetical protein ACLT3Y_07065 [Ruminococcus callidus]
MTRAPSSTIITRAANRHIASLYIAVHSFSKKSLRTLPHDGADTPPL